MNGPAKEGRLKRLALSLACVLALPLLAACATPGDALTVPDSTSYRPQQWAISNPTGPEIDLQTYWRLLDDPLVDEFVDRARSDNLDLAQSVTRLRAAQARLHEARAARLPSASTNAGVGRDFGDSAQDSFRFVLGGEISWEADLFGRISNSIDASRADLIAAGYTLADLERVIVASVATQTITARSLARQLEISRDTLANQDDNLQIARWRNQAGLVSSLDVEQARTQRAQTAATIPQLESDLVATANAISTLIGEPPGGVFALLIAEPRDLPVSPRSVDLSVPAEMLRRRPDVNAAEAQLAADLARVGVARAQLYPLLRLTGSVGSAALGIGNLFSVISGDAFAGLTQLLFDGGRTRAQIEGAQAIADGSLAGWRQSILVALEDVETAAIDLETSEERVAAFIEARDGARNAAVLARSQYEAGLIDFQRLLTVESALLSARTAEVAAEASRAIAFVNLARALGGGWRSPQAIQAVIATGQQDS